MVPVFKSTYSIGKSILKLEEIVTLCKDNDINPLVLVEDCMTGFVKSHNVCAKEGIHLIFGLRLTCCNDIEQEEDSSDYKVIVFAKDDEGCKLLNKIYSFSQMSGNGKIDFKYLNSVWSEASLELVIPFYDSFIHGNQLYLKNCIPDFTKIKPIFWIEENNLPFDPLIKEAVEEYTKDKYSTQLVKSIFYKEEGDVEALQTYKIICGRKFGRAATLSCPNLDHFGSDEFCLNSFLKNSHD